MSELYRSYEEYSKTLRTWFVAFGVGAPLVFLTNERLATKLSTAPTVRYLVAAYFFGVALQVLLAIINKNIMWGCYYGQTVPEFKSTRRYKFAEWFSGQYWIDAVADFLTGVLFVLATLRAFLILFP